MRVHARTSNAQAKEFTDSGAVLSRVAAEAVKDAALAAGSKGERCRGCWGGVGQRLQRPACTYILLVNACNPKHSV